MATNNRKKILREINNIILVVLGSALLAFGDAAFITPHNLVTGGVISVGVIILINWGLKGIEIYIKRLRRSKRGDDNDEDIAR